MAGEPFTKRTILFSLTKHYLEKGNIQKEFNRIDTINNKTHPEVTFTLNVSEPRAPEQLQWRHLRE